MIAQLSWPRRFRAGILHRTIGGRTNEATIHCVFPGGADMEPWKIRNYESVAGIEE